MKDVNAYIDEHHKDETFVQMMLRLIDEKRLTDKEIYQKAFLDRKFFSKMRCDIHYKPKKKNVCALALALELDQPTSKTFIKKAGYILSSSNTFDLVIRYCINNKIYDLIIVNELLYDQNQDTLF